MSKYINESNFPINLFNQYDFLTFNSFKEIIDFYKNELRIKRFDYQNLFKEQDCNKFLVKVLDFFPFIFFVDSKIDVNQNIEQILKANLFVKDASKLHSLFHKRVDLKIVYEQLVFIGKQEDCSVNYPQFVNHLFRYLYKYSFFEITDSIYLDDQKKYCVSDYIRDYKNFVKELNNPSDKYFASEFLKGNSQEFFKSFINQFDNSISNDSSIVDNTIAELELVGNNSNLSRLLYSIIDNNIQTPSTKKPNFRNKLLRPLFHEIVCNLTNDEWYSLDTNDSTLVNRQKNFVFGYKKFIKINRE